MPSIIEKLIPLADAHQAADQYSRGIYWNYEDGPATQGCAVGCTVRDAIKLGVLNEGTDPDDHRALAGATGLSEALWRLVDVIFELLPCREATAWPPRFLRAAAACQDAARAERLIVAGFVSRLVNSESSPSFREVAELVAGLWRMSEGETTPELTQQYRVAKGAFSRATDTRGDLLAPLYEALIRFDSGYTPFWLPRMAKLAWLHGSAGIDELADIVCEALQVKE